MVLFIINSIIKLQIKIRFIQNLVIEAVIVIPSEVRCINRYIQVKENDIENETKNLTVMNNDKNLSLIASKNSNKEREI